MVAAPLAIAFHVHYGWRVAFLGTSLVGLLWIPAWLAVTSGAHARAILARPPDPPPQPPQADESGGPGVGYRDPALAPPPPGPARGLVEIALLLKLPHVQRGVVLILATAPTMNFVYSWMPKYLAETFQISQAGLAPYLWLPPLFFDAGSILSGVAASLLRRRGDAVGVPPWLVAFGGVSCMSIGAMVFSPTATVAVALASVGLFGGGACYALLTSDMLARVEPSVVSRAGGLSAASQSLAVIVANLIIGYVVGRTHSYGGVLIGLGAIVVPGTIAWLAWPHSGPSRA
jgi:predicted MFS family arabinose efflux permease